MPGHRRRQRGVLLPGRRHDLHRRALRVRRLQRHRRPLPGRARRRRQRGRRVRARLRRRPRVRAQRAVRARVLRAQDPRDGVKAFELQADCMAGLWGNAVYREGRYDDRDVEEAISTAQAAGDFDYGNAQHHGTPDERRTAWLAGFQTGDPAQCATCRALLGSSRAVAGGIKALARAPTRSRQTGSRFSAKAVAPSRASLGREYRPGDLGLALPRLGLRPVGRGGDDALRGVDRQRTVAGDQGRRARAPCERPPGSVRRETMPISARRARRRSGRRSGQLHREVVRDPARQAQQRPGAATRPALDLGDAEAGVARGHDQVARARPRTRRPAPSPRRRRSAACAAAAG